MSKKDHVKITTSQAADILGVNKKLLDLWRFKGQYKELKYIEDGILKKRIWYFKDNVIEFLENLRKEKMEALLESKFENEKDRRLDAYYKMIVHNKKPAIAN